MHALVELLPYDEVNFYLRFKRYPYSHYSACRLKTLGERKIDPAGPVRRLMRDRSILDTTPVGNTYLEKQGDRIINRARLRQAINRRDQSIDILKRQALYPCSIVRCKVLAFEKLHQSWPYSLHFWCGKSKGHFTQLTVGQSVIDEIKS
jgi:hypothetical protein